MDLVESSSDEEYFPTTETLQVLPNETETETENPYEEDDDDISISEDPDLEDEYLEDPSDEEIQETHETDVERILLQNNPGLLHQIQQVLQHGIGVRTQTERPRRRRAALPAVPSPPYEKGRQLVNSGEFGTVDDPGGKRRFEGARTINQFARFREMGWRTESLLPLSRGWLPAERMGRLVARYDRHVYSGQFSHDGGFFYTAAQDFRCRMYSTLNPSNPRDWKLYKVPPTTPPQKPLLNNPRFKRC
jgi:hypothetical protein